MRPPRRFGSRIVRYEETESTQDALRALALAGADEGTVVVAERQSAGRGRDARAWSSPKGGLYASILLRPSAPPEAWGLLPIAAGVALHDVVAPVLPQARLKWPNDVVVPHDGSWRKLAGVLAEAKTPDYVLLGVGLNVNTRLDELPEHATSIAALAHAVDLDDALEALLRRMEARYGQFEARRDADLIAAWERRAAFQGAEVRAGEVAGRQKGLAPSGALVLATADGGTVEVSVGDVTRA